MMKNHEVGIKLVNFNIGEYGPFRKLINKATENRVVIRFLDL